MTTRDAGPSAGRRRRPALAAVVAAVAVGLYVADVFGVKPPPRVLPSLVLAGVAVALGVGVGDRAGTGHGRDAGAGETRSRWRGVMRTVGWAVGWAGVALQVAVVVPFAAIGLVAPPLGAFAIHALWAALLAVALRLRRTRPELVLLVPPLTVGLVLAVLGVGGTWLGWGP